MGIEGQGNERGQLHLSRMIINMLLWSCPVSGCHRLLCILTNSISNYFHGEGTVYSVCVWVCMHMCMRCRVSGDSRAGGYSK